MLSQTQLMILNCLHKIIRPQGKWVSDIICLSRDTLWLVLSIENRKMLCNWFMSLKYSFIVPFSVFVFVLLCYFAKSMRHSFYIKLNSIYIHLILNYHTELHASNYCYNGRLTSTVDTNRHRALST